MHRLLTIDLILNKISLFNNLEFLNIDQPAIRQFQKRNDGQWKERQHHKWFMQ